MAKKIELEALPDDNEPSTKYPRLTKREERMAQAKALSRIEETKKQEELDRAEFEAEEKLKADMGEHERHDKMTQNLRPEDKEVVEITVRLARHIPELRIDGVIYQNGQTYRVLTAVAKEILYLMYKGDEHEAVIKGDDRFAFLHQQAQKNRGVTHLNGRTGTVTHEKVA